ncbi:hypothetical protein SAMN05421759_102637 [Roseivivax lentus]|uniref:Uncharacterized protein n=1 Tax=Roseivivax lentus TaxID=633194 RepID=A0A1N7LEL0_9RHOB|nr:hypothetical protein [Roseivivax lentus]SIS72268.1 hypothetical protein SAMN05421759_102637 [Roseivivax lentus]
MSDNTKKKSSIDIRALEVFWANAPDELLIEAAKTQFDADTVNYERGSKDARVGTRESVQIIMETEKYKRGTWYSYETDEHGWLPLPEGHALPDVDRPEVTPQRGSALRKWNSREEEIKINQPPVKYLMARGISISAMKACRDLGVLKPGDEKDWQLLFRYGLIAHGDFMGVQRSLIGLNNERLLIDRKHNSPPLKKQALGGFGHNGQQAYFTAHRGRDNLPVFVFDGAEDALTLLTVYLRDGREDIPTIISTLGTGRFKGAARQFRNAVLVPDIDGEEPSQDGKPEWLKRAEKAARLGSGLVSNWFSILKGAKDLNAWWVANKDDETAIRRLIEAVETTYDVGQTAISGTVSRHPNSFEPIDGLASFQSNSSRHTEIFFGFSAMLNETRTLFRYADMPVMVIENETSAVIAYEDGTQEKETMFSPVELNETFATFALEKVTQWYSVNAEGEEIQKPVPQWAKKHLINGRGVGLPSLMGIARYPMMTSQGIRSGNEGYDPKTKMYWRTGELDVSFDGTAEEALDLLENELLGPFPFTSRRDRLRALALPMTLLVRRIMLTDGYSPAFLFRASVAGSFKTHLATMLCQIVLDRKIGSLAYTKNEEEFRKQLFAYALGDPDILFYDNVANGTSWNQPDLDKYITSGSITDRILGKSETKDIRASFVPVLTGNKITFSQDDAATRFCVIELFQESKTDMEAVAATTRLVSEHRGRLIGAMAKILSVEATKKPAEFRFDRWWELVGGPLSKVSGDDNLFEGMYAGADRYDPLIEVRKDLVNAMTDFLEYEQVDAELEDLRLLVKEQNGYFTWSQLVQACGPELREAIDLAEHVSMNPKHSRSLQKLHGDQRCTTELGVVKIVSEQSQFREKNGKSRNKVGFRVVVVQGNDEIPL